MTIAAHDDETAELHRLVDEIRDAGIHRVHVLAWRDLDDPDAGGSEVHADHFMRRWADAGLDVLHRTSAGVGIPATARRNGYDVVRRGSRYSVFPRTVVAELTRRMGRFDGLVEIWNGVPWFSPVWCRRPRITIVHHVHGPMWDQILPGPLAGLGRALETRLAPPFYRRTEVVTPSRIDARRTAGDRVRTGARDGGRQRRRAVLHARRAPLRRADHRRHRTAGTGQTFRPADRGCRRGRAHDDPRPAGADHRRGTGTSGSRGVDPTPRRRSRGSPSSAMYRTTNSPANTGGHGSSPVLRSPRAGVSPSPRRRPAVRRPSRPTSRGTVPRSSTA